MNYVPILRLCSLFILLSYGHALYTQPTQPINYYELIGLDYEEYKKDIADKIEQLQDEDKVYADKDITAKITKACKQVREEYYPKAIEKAQKELQEAESIDRKKKTEVLLELQKRLNLTKTACPLLLDPKKRRSYDAQLEQPEVGDTFFQRMQNGISNAMLLAPDKKVIINDIVGDLLSQIEIPGPALKVFNQNLEVRSLSLLPRPMGPDVRYGIGFTGLMSLNRVEVRLSVYVIQDIYGARKFSFNVELPKTYKISDLFPTFRGFDAFEFPQAKFIISSFEGMDKDGFPFKRGFNFGALLNLAGPLQALGDLRDKASMLKSLVFESEPIILNGVIPLDITQAEFTAHVPLYIGVDLRKIAAMPKTISNVINKITTDDFTLSILPVKAKKETKMKDGEEVEEEIKPYLPVFHAQREPTTEVVTSQDGTKEDIRRVTPTVKQIAKLAVGYRVEAETGIRITLGTQREPLRFTIHGIVIPVSKDYPQGFMSVGGNMKGMLQLKWLALGNVRVYLDFDGALMEAAAAFGIPFTGMGIGGQLDLGKAGVSRASLSVAGGFRVSSTELPDLVFDVSGDNIRFADLISFVLDKAAQAKLLKAPIPADRIPTMTLHRIWGYCALGDTTIAGKFYREGLGLQVETEIFNHKAGLRIFMNNKFQLSGWGYMPAIDFKVKGSEVFRLYGVTHDKGPQLEFNFDPQNPSQGSFALQGTVHIPGLGLKHKTDFSWRGYTLEADFETQFPAGFSALFGIRMNLKEGTEMLSSYEQVKDEVENLLAKVGMGSADARAAQQLLEQARELEKQKKHGEAMGRLQRARSLLGGAQPVPAGDTRVPGIALSQEAATNLKMLEIKMRDLKAEMDALLQAGAAYAQEADYRAGEEYIKQATIEYQQYYSPDAKERWDALYQMTFNTLLSKARKKLPITDQENKLIVAGAERAVILAKIKKVESIIKTLQKAQKPLEKVVGYEIKPATDDDITKKREVETDPGAKWRKLYVKIGFKGDFAKYINEHAVATLRRVKENATKKLDQLTERVASLQAQAVGSVDTEIERVKATIAAKEKEIQAAQTACRALPLYRQPKCRASIAAQQTVLASRKAYLTTLLKPGKAVVRGVTGVAASAAKQLAQSKALRAATEAVLEGMATGLEMIATGINFFNITEALGEYSWEDMQTLKLPRLVRLVANIELPGMPMQIVLTDLQFDFKNPGQSAALISQALATAFIEQQQNKYLKYAERLINE